METPDIGPLDDYFRLMNGNGITQAYLGALRSGVLAAVCNGGSNLEQICQQCETKPRPTELLLNILISLGLLDETEGVYRASMLAFMLLTSQYRELGQAYWDHLPELLRTDQPMVAMDAVENSEAHYVQQAELLGWMLSPCAKECAEAYATTVSLTDHQILDVGCGAAIWSLMIAAHDSTTRVSAIDWPAVLKVAEDTADSFGLQDQFACLPGNYHEVELPADTFDLVIMANITHLESESNNLALFQRGWAALKSGGRLMVVDAFPTPGQGAIACGLYALGLALRTNQGTVHQQATLERLLRKAGFQNLTLTPFNKPPHMVGALSGQKD